jgi:hypothetical protein
MHKIATKIGGIVRGAFTNTIIFEGKINKPQCNIDVIGSIRETTIKEKQQLKILLNALIQHQEHLNISKNALTQLNLHTLKNLN